MTMLIIMLLCVFLLTMRALCYVDMLVCHRTGRKFDNASRLARLVCGLAVTFLAFYFT